MHNLTIGATNAAINQHLVTFAPQVKQVFRTGLEFESMLPFVSADEVYTASNVSLGDIVQPYQPRFTPNNVENWDAVSNTLRPIKIDLEFTEEQLQKFYDKWKNMWFEAGKDPLEWSYPRYIIEQVVAPKYREEINRAYESEIGTLTAMIADELQDAADTYPKQWILDAIHEAAVQNKRGWKYCLAILKRWKAQGNQNPLPGMQELS